MEYSGANEIPSEIDPLPLTDDVLSVADHAWLIVRERELEADEAVPAIGIPFERLTDTPLGSVTILRQETSLVPYDAYDLIDLLATTDPTKDLRLVAKDDSNHLVYPPGNQDVVLRWNTGKRIKPTAPLSYVELETHAETYEQVLARAQQLGLITLNRNVFIVEDDQHHNGQAAIYTATERHWTDEPLTTAEEYKYSAPIYAHTELHLQLCNTSIACLENTPEDTPFIHDSLVAPCQFAKDGTLFDYDAYLRTSITAKIDEAEAVNAWLACLPRGIEQQRLAARTNRLITQLYEKYWEAAAEVE